MARDLPEGETRLPPTSPYPTRAPQRRKWEPMHVQSRAATTSDSASGRRPSRRVVVVAAALAVIATMAVGCSSGSSSGSSTSSTSVAASTTAVASSTAPSYPAGKEQVCQARDQLKTSINALANPSLLLGGTSAIASAVDQVQTDLTALSAAAKDDYKPQTTAVQTSLQQLQTAVGDLGNGDMTKNLQTVGTAIASVGTAGESLFTQLKTACGS